jgi:hypothetical protein
LHRSGVQGLLVGLEVPEEVTEQFIRTIGVARMEHPRSTLILLLEASECTRSLGGGELWAEGRFCYGSGAFWPQRSSQHRTAGLKASRNQ